MTTTRRIDSTMEFLIAYQVLWCHKLFSTLFFIFNGLFRVVHQPAHRIQLMGLGLCDFFLEVMSSKEANNSNIAIRAAIALPAILLITPFWLLGQLAIVALTIAQLACQMFDQLLSNNRERTVAFLEVMKYEYLAARGPLLLIVATAHPYEVNDAVWTTIELYENEVSKRGEERARPYAWRHARSVAMARLRPLISLLTAGGVLHRLYESGKHHLRK